MSRKTLADPNEVRELYAAIDNEYGNYDVKTSRLEGDWRVLGDGISRIALLSPSGVVYKVPFSEYSNRTSDLEFEALSYYAGEEYAIRMERYSFDGITILACEYVENTEPLVEWYQKRCADESYIPHSCSSLCANFSASVECYSYTFNMFTLAQRIQYVRMAQHFSDLHEYNFAINAEGNIKLLDGGELVSTGSPWNRHHSKSFRRVL